MCTDILNKPCQGMKFYKYRVALMNLTVYCNDEV